MILEKVSAKRSWKRLTYFYTWQQKSTVILENITATRSWKKLICFHRWEQKSKVTLEKVTAKEPWKRHGRNATAGLGKGQKALEKAKKPWKRPRRLWKMF